MAEQAAEHTPPDLLALLTEPATAVWARHLVQHHLDPAERRALHQTCTAARDVVVTASPYMTITIPLQQAAAAATATRRVLQTRPPQSVGLHLSEYAFCQPCHFLQMCEMLVGSAAVDSVHMMQRTAHQAAAALQETLRRFGTPSHTVYEHPPSIPPAFTAAFPRLTRLSISVDSKACLAALTPAALPCLRQLHMQIHSYSNPANDPQVAAQVQLLVNRFLAQLTTLEVLQYRDTQIVNLTLPTTPAPRLLRLAMPMALVDVVVDHLLQYAPQLQHLTFTSTHLQTDHSSTLCSWRSVSGMGRVTNMDPESTEWRLPRSWEGDLRLTDVESVWVDMKEENIEPWLVKRNGLQLCGRPPAEGEVKPAYCSFAAAEGVTPQRQALQLRVALAGLRGLLKDFDSWLTELYLLAMTVELLSGLALLPAQGEVVVKWSGSPEASGASLLCSLPPGVTKVDLSHAEGSVSAAVASAILQGAPRDRTADRPLQVVFNGVEGVEDDALWVTQQQTQLTLLCPHVTVKLR